MNLRRRNLLIAAAAVVVVAGVASAVNDGSGSTTTTAASNPTLSSPPASAALATTANTPATDSASPSVPAPSGSAAVSSPGDGFAPVSGVPSPDTVQTADLLKRLGGISPVLARDEDKAVRRARSQCLDIVNGEPTEKLVSSAAYRFTTIGLETISTDQAQQIVDAVEASFCPAP